MTSAKTERSSRTGLPQHPVGRDDNLRLGAAVLIGQTIEGFGANEWLIRQDDEGGIYLRIERGEAGSQ